MQIPFIDLRAQHKPLREEINVAIQEVIESSAFAGGPFVAKFEEEFARFCQSSCAVGLGSGTDALWLALLSLGIGPGDEVITVPMTFIATVEAITYCGAKPVFVDIEERTYTIDVGQLEEAITPRTKAIIPVHLFGQPADMDSLLEIARHHGIAVIEDACQAHGALYKQKPAGTMGDIGCFSFYPGKNLGAMGEAGAIVTTSEQFRDKVRMLRDHGQSKKYFHEMVGWNARMDGIQAAILSIKLKHLETGNERRRLNAAHYAELLSAIEEVITPAEADGRRHVYHIYAVRVPDRDRLFRQLGGRGIQCGIHYPVPLHLQEAYRFLGYGANSFPVSEKCAAELLSLPMFPELSPEQIARVAGELESSLRFENATGI